MGVPAKNTEDMRLVKPESESPFIPDVADVDAAGYRDTVVEQ